ncbi:MAG: T9SS type A sorting domain-containing protein [bacterium]
MKKIIVLLFAMSSIAYSQWSAVNSGITTPFDQTTFSLLERGANSSLLLQSSNTGGVSPRLYRSTNNGDQWTLLPSTGTYNCYLEYNGRLFAGRNGGSGVVYSTDDGKTWTNASGFPATVNIIDLDVIGSTLFAANILGGVYVSTDNGNTWQSKNGSGARKFAKIGTTLYVGIFGGVIKSTDLGTTWTTVNNGLTGIILQTDRLVASNTSLIAFTGGNIFRSTNGGDNWTQKTLPVSIAGTTDFSTLDAEGNNVIALNAQTIILSTDAGDTWTNITKDFPVYAYYIWQNVKAQCAILSGSYVICGTYPASATIPAVGVYRTSVGAATSGPSIPTLTSPANNSTTVSVPATFSWSPVSGATSYTIQISTSSTFATFAVNQSGITTALFTASGLANGTSYYWRVSATNASGTSAYSTTNAFFTTLVGPPPPTLLSPADASTNVPVNTTLSWSAVAGVTFYKVQISTNATFTQLLVSENVLTGTSYAPTVLSNNTLYYWRVNANGASGLGVFSEARSFKTITTTSVEAIGDALPLEFSLSQNYPNPFNPSTSFQISIPQRSRTVLKIYDVIGKEVATLIEQELPAGQYNVRWNAVNHQSGIYFATLRTGSLTQTRKVTLMK